MMFGLIGKNITHSFSKEIHNLFGNNNYELFDIDKIDDFIKTNNLKGFNITMPYKTEIIPYLNLMDEIAKATNSVNTVIKENNQYFGYNTDYYGFIELLNYNRINIENKNVIILGNGGVAKTVCYALKTLKAKTIVKLGRNLKEDSEDLYGNYQKYSNFDMIINTTPVGMYPHNDEALLINLEKFDSLEVVIDLIYNPLRTSLLIKAEELNIKAINGLYMLIMQAKKAHELFLSCELPVNLANKVYRKLSKKLYNLVFIGLPLSGKSKYTKIMSEKMHKKAYDTDNLIENQIGMSIPQYFETHSEREFREVESRIVEDIYKLNNSIISTGGGLIKVKKNIDLLKQNGIIIFLDKNPESIAKKVIRGRPLIKKSSDILQLAKERMPIYKNSCDISIAINKDTVYHINEIKEKINEYINNKRP